MKIMIFKVIKYTQTLLKIIHTLGLLLNAILTVVCSILLIDIDIILLAPTISIGYKRSGNKIVEMNLAQEGLDAQKTLEPITYETLDIAKNEEIAGNILGQILPFILIIGVLLGSIHCK